jgi:TolA-binding protein
MTPRFSWLWLAVLSAHIGAVSVLADASSDRLQFADGLYTRGMYELAGKEYAVFLEKFPEGAKRDAATFRLAECLRLNGSAEDAGKLYARVVVEYKKSPFRLRAAYRRARLYMDAEDFESAIAHFNVILELTPPADLAAATLYYLSEARLATGEGADADAACAQIVEKHPKSMFYAFALMRRGEIHRDRWQAGNGRAAKQALDFFGKALERPGTDRIAAEALFQMAEILFRLHEFEKSADRYQKLMTRFPADERSRVARMQAAWSASNAGLYAEAVKLSDQALADSEIAEGRDEWLYIKANAERQLLQSKNAVKTYLELLIQYPESRLSQAARYETAVAYYKMGDYASAIRHSEQVRMTPELRTDICWLLAESYAATDRGSKATQYYRMVIRDAAGSDRARDAMYRLAHQLQKQKAYREASGFYNTLVTEFPKDPLAPQSLYASAFCLAQADAHDEAARDWRRLVQEYPKHELVQEAFYQKAMSEIRLERRTDATSTLAELLRLFPEGRFAADAYYWKGMMLREKDKFSEAELALHQAVLLASRDELRQEAIFQLGLVLHKLGRDAEAAELLQQLLASPLSEKFPPSLLEWLSIHHAEQGAPAEAVKAAELLLQASENPAWIQAGWVLLGRAELERGNAATAKSAFKMGVDVDVTTRYASEAALRLGDMAIADKDSKAAESYFRLASEKAANESDVGVRARAFYGLGKAAELAGSDDAASRYFMSVAILYDHDELVPESLYHAAAAFYRLKRTEEHRKAVQELEDRYPQSAWAGKAKKTWQN